MRVFSRIKRENGIENINLEEINAEITASRILHFDDTYCRKESFFMSLTEIFDNIVEIDGLLSTIITVIFTFLITKYTYHKNIPLDKMEKSYNRVYYPIYRLIKGDDSIEKIVEKCEMYFNKYDKYTDVSTWKAFINLKENLNSPKTNKAYSNFKNNIYAFDTKLRRRLGYLESNVFTTYTYSSPSDKKIMRVYIEIMGTYLPFVIMGYVSNEKVKYILTGIGAFFAIALLTELLIVVIKLIIKGIAKLMSVLKKIITKRVLLKNRVRKKRLL